MEELVLQQKEIGEAITKILKNYKKTPDDRRREKYVQEKLQALAIFWESFETLHGELLSAHQEDNPDHAYFTAKYYEQVEEMYKSTKSLLEEKLRQLLELNNVSDKEASSEGKKTSETKQSTDASNSAIFEQKMRLRKQMALVELLTQAIDKVTKEKTMVNTKGYYQQKIKTLSEYWSRISMNHEDIITSDAFNKDESYIRNNTYSTIEDLFQVTVIWLQDKYDQLSTTSESASTAIFNQKIKLAPLNIPNFNGNYYNWSTFHDLFTQLIHNNMSLGKAQKMHYLKTNISGEAAKLLKHLQITDQNYDTAWELLNNRFNNSRLLLSAQLQNLLSQQTLKFESAEDIRKLHDNTKECLLAIKNLGIDTSNWDPFIIHLVIQKMDRDTHRLYEQSLQKPREVQRLDDLFKFLEARFQSLEAVTDKRRNESQLKTFNSKRHEARHQSHKFDQNRATAFKTYHNTIKNQCCACKGEHKIFGCNKFINMNTNQRWDIIKREKLCSNCLQQGHSGNQCKSISTCRVCHQRHNTLLHQDPIPSAPRSQNTSYHIAARRNPHREMTQPLHQDEIVQQTQLSSHLANNQSTTNNVLLATALVKATSANGSTETLRALIDQGSQASFITEDAAQRLRVPKQKIHATVSGLGAAEAGIVKNCVQILIQPTFPSTFQINVTALVLSKLTKILPSSDLQAANVQHLKNILLADPTFDKPGPIDIIFGADVFAEIIMNGVIKAPFGNPVAQRTELGWILSGCIQHNPVKREILCLMIQSELEEQLKKFWELEEVPQTKFLTDEEMECQEFYKRTVNRRSDGKYIVRIPFRAKDKECKVLGETKTKALCRLLQMERRFSSNIELADQYKQFMREYAQLGHMKQISISSNEENKDICYLPHHAVLKPDSSSTKLRVVFDASVKSTTQISLNDLMMTGPTLQQDLSSILLRWRKHKVVYTADIEKMYRQIMVADEDQQFQRILWRDTPNEAITAYNLTTVTYGTRSAPYLAVRTLHQLAHDEEKEYPAASKIVLSDFYVDDVLSGGDNIEEALAAQRELIQLLNKGGFKLRKWCSNSIKMLTEIPEELRANTSIELQFNQTIKTLGIHWQPSSDAFEFKIKLPPSKTVLTKRNFLSEVSSLFDPLGWLAPTIIIGKIMFQELWLTGITWDDKLPLKLMSKWNSFREELILLQDIRIPRWINYTNDCLKCELHGFSDASERAYAAVIYIRIITRNNKIFSSILAAKTKVAPLSKRISLPKLELCGALLLTKLMKQVKEAVDIENMEYFGWTDSTIVLAWIKNHPSKWKTFVANRVAEIHGTNINIRWHHIKSSDNPADCASRGITPSQLVRHSLWWSGPGWLIESEAVPLCEENIETNLELRKEVTALNMVTATVEEFELLSRFSNLTKLKRVTAYIIRFIKNCKNKREIRTMGDISLEEIKEAMKTLIRLIQQQNFAAEIKGLRRVGNIHAGSKLIQLNPFLGEDGLLRVGGRLHYSSLTLEEKHPIIIPHKGPLTTLIIDWAHRTMLHGGPQLTLSYIRKTYWIVKGHSAVKQIIHRCVRCHRFNIEIGRQLMGNLPRPRVNYSRPFTNTGVDYCGPIELKMHKGRNSRCYKGYISLFVCLATKAVHLEIVTDLTAQAFIAAFKRLAGRRGNIANMYSDNATNFVLASKILKLQSEILKTSYNQEVQHELINMGTQWHFIPPSSPHFGGLWEAGVKSVKNHLRRTIGEVRLTYEELSTVLIQIEACLNSRPLCPMREDPEDLDILTPGHFLIGTSLTAPPAEGLTNKNTNLLTRWQLLDRMHQEFWRKWSREYLTRLQQRPKWTCREKNIKIGDLVVIKDEQLPPTKWALGRVVETHVGGDGLVRVITLKAKNHIFKRPIHKVAPLPISDNDKPEGASEEKQVNINQFHSCIETTFRPSSDCKQIRSSLFSKKTGRIKHYWTLILIFLYLMFSSLRGQYVNDSPEVIPFTSQPGIYFEDIGQIKLINSNWNLVVYYDLQNYWDELYEIRFVMKKLRMLCNTHTASNNYCQLILQEFEHQLITMESNDEILQNHAGGKAKKLRTKRSPLNIIGSLANKLFGILDQNFADHYRKQIELINQNENHLLQLLKNQTSIIDATTNIIAKGEERFHKHLAHIDNLLANLTSDMNDFDKELQQLETSHIFNTITSLTNLILNHCQRVQDMLIEIVADIHHGKINPNLLMPVQLQTHLHMIRSNIPSHLELPGRNGHNILQLYKLMTARVKITNHYAPHRGRAT